MKLSASRLLELAKSLNRDVTTIPNSLMQGKFRNARVVVLFAKKKPGFSEAAGLLKTKRPSPAALISLLQLG